MPQKPTSVFMDSAKYNVDIMWLHSGASLFEEITDKMHKEKK